MRTLPLSHETTVDNLNNSSIFETIMNSVEAEQKAQKLFSVPLELDSGEPHEFVLTSVLNMVKRRAGKQGQPYRWFALSRYMFGEIDMSVEHAVFNKTFAGKRYAGRICLVSSDEWGVKSVEYRLSRNDNNNFQLSKLIDRVDSLEEDPSDIDKLLTGYNGLEATAAPVSAAEANLLENLLLYEQPPMYHFSV